MKKRGFDLDDLSLLKKIGTGSFSEVFLVKDKQTDKFYAAKILINSNINSNEREIGILSRLHHPAILKFLGYSPVNFQKES